MESHKNLLNIRFRIFILTLLTIIPVVILIFYINAIQLKRAKETEIVKLKNIAHVISSENIQIIEGARQLLISLSVTQEIENQGSICAQYLNNLLNKYLRYSNFGIVDSRGNVVCSATPLKTPVNLADRYFFQQTQKSNDFTIGEYVLSKTTNKASLNFGYPSKKINSVIYATLSLDWLNKLVADLEIPKGQDVVILDRQGVILAKNPGQTDTIGQTFENSELLAQIKTRDEGEIESTDNGTERIYIYKKMGIMNDGPFIVVGQDLDILIQKPNSDFRITIFFSIVVAIISIAMGILVGNQLITKTLTSLNEIESLKRDFISLVSHQIRTPITAIKWFTEILLSKSPGKLTKKQMNILKDTHMSTKRMVDLIGTLLNISKLESKRLPVNQIPTDVTKLIKDVVKETYIEFKFKKIKKIITIQKGFPKKVAIDPKLIRQVFLNIIHNAYKYSFSGGKIEISIYKKGNNVIFSVTDHGIGIPVNERPLLFQKFSRASNAKVKDTDGAGLGLYLAKLIVEAHKGKIVLLDTKGGGTSIYFTIPIT